MSSLASINCPAFTSLSPACAAKIFCVIVIPIAMILPFSRRHSREPPKQVTKNILNHYNSIPVCLQPPEQRKAKKVRLLSIITKKRHKYTCPPVKGMILPKFLALPQRKVYNNSIILCLSTAHTCCRMMFSGGDLSAGSERFDFQ